jgi:phospholipid/cholesterol/gamma-HCH transport system ATP-binding protein
MIEIQNVYKSFDEKNVLNNISAIFESGKTNLIIGQSGSGKTVLMKSIIGLHRIDSGKILYDGRNIPDMQFMKIKKLRQEVGMLFQGSALFDSQTVAQNVMFPLEMFSNMTQIEIENRMKFCLGRVNLDASTYKLFPSEISGGMQKRAAIARAIALNPRYLFCDEPNSGLDPLTSLVIDRLIKEITEEYDITTIVNTHDMNSVMEIGENIIFIKNGEKAWEGNRHQIFDSNNDSLNDFVFASDLYKKVKETSNIHTSD